MVRHSNRCHVVVSRYSHIGSKHFAMIFALHMRAREYGLRAKTKTNLHLNLFVWRFKYANLTQAVVIQLWTVFSIQLYKDASRNQHSLQFIDVFGMKPALRRARFQSNTTDACSGAVGGCCERSNMAN